MRKAMAVLVIVLLAAFVTDGILAAEPQTQKGSKFVYYGFSGLSNLGIDGSYIGGGTFFKDDLGVYLALSMALKNTDPGSGEEVSDNTFGFNLGLEWFVWKKGAVGFNLIPYLTYNNRSEDASDDLGSYTLKQNKIGVGLGLGVEWWATESISLFGGASVGFKSTSGTREYASSEVEYSTTEIGFVDPSSSLGISFWF